MKTPDPPFIFNGSSNTTLFDLAKAREARDAGISQVGGKKPGWLEEARGIALWHIATYGSVTIDDVRLRLASCPDVHHNIWGAVFKDRRFKWTGRYTTSSKVSSHARAIKVWGRA